MHSWVFPVASGLKSFMAAKCAWCGEPRGAGATCPECGADYEKAARIKAGKKAETKSAPNKAQIRAEAREANTIAAWSPVKDVAFERQLCLFAVPAMLAACLLLEVIGVGDALFRIVFGMPVHEMGHAVAGWFTGYNSVPTLWKTIIPENRGYIAPLLLFAGLCYLLNYARVHAYGGLFLLVVVLLLLQFIGSLVLSKGSAQVMIIWAGDGLGIMLATALMIGFNFDKQTNWYKGYLRWGFAFIGAAAFADMVVPWWKSLSDISHVPYGTTGGNHTDTYKLMVYYGWSMDEVIHRYVYLSVVCGVVLSIFQYAGIQRVTRVIALRRKLAAEEQTEADT